LKAALEAGAHGEIEADSTIPDWHGAVSNEPSRFTPQRLAKGMVRSKSHQRSSKAGVFDNNKTSRMPDGGRDFWFRGQTRWSSAFRLFRAENMLKHELQPLAFTKEMNLPDTMASPKVSPPT